MLLTLATMAGKPNASRVGKVIREPDPTMALTVPATRPAPTMASASRTDMERVYWSGLVRSKPCPGRAVGRRRVMARHSACRGRPAAPQIRAPRARSGASSWVGRLGASEASQEQITPVEGLSALSLDALTSVAYGPEAILVVLAAAGGSALHLILPITIAIVVLLDDPGHLLPPGDRRLSARAVAPTRSPTPTSGPEPVSWRAPRSSSTTRSPWRSRSRREWGSSPPPSLACRGPPCPCAWGILAVITVLNLRGPRRHGPSLSRAHRRSSSSGLLGIIVGGAHPPLGDPRPQPGPKRASHPGLEAVGLVLVLQGIRSGVQRPHRRGGDRQRRAAVQRAPR